MDSSLIHFRERGRTCSTRWVCRAMPSVRSRSRPARISADDGSPCWQRPWSTIGGLILVLTGGLLTYMALVLAHGKPAHERVLVTAFGAVFLIAGALRCWRYFTNRKRELVVTTVEGRRGVLYMDHHRQTFLAFLEKLEKAFAQSDRDRLESLSYA